MPRRKRSASGRRRRRYPLIRIALMCGLVGWGAPRAAHAIAGTELFRVRDVQLSGGHYLTQSEAVEWTAIPPDAHLWDDPSGWVARLAEHPLVRAAQVRRRLPGTLVLVVEEREPVALAAAATLQPVDEKGRALPLDPATWALDLPLIRARAGKRGSEAEGASGEAGLGVLAAEAARLTRIDPEFMARTSELSVDERGDLIARWGEPPVAFRFRPAVTARRLEEGMTVLLDAVARTGELPRAIDLRFADQVVVQAR
jgi:hypothetical protein